MAAESSGFLLDRIFPWLMRYRALVIGFWAVFSVLAGAGLTQLRFDADYRVFFDDDNPQLRAYDKIQGKYTTDDAVIIAVKRDQGVFHPQVLRVVKTLTEAAWTLSHVSRVDSLANYMHSKADGDALIVQELFGETEKITGDVVKNVRQVATSEAMVQGNLVSADATLTLIRIVYRLPSTDPEILLNVKAEVVRHLEEHRQKLKGTGIELHLSGNIIAGIAFAEASQADMVKLIPIMVMIMVITLTFMFRSVLAMLLTMMAVAISAVITIGLVGWSGMAISATTASAPITIMTLAVADSIHLLTSYFGKRTGETPKIVALEQAFQANLTPIFITSVTTCIGFLSMNTNDIPPFRELGTIVAVGVAFAFLVVLTLTPALLAVLPGGDKPVGRSTLAATTPGGWEQNLGRWIVGHRHLAFWGGFGVCVLGLLGMTQLEVNDSPVTYFSEKIPFREATNTINDRIGGFETLEYSLQSGEDNGIFAPEYLEKIQAFTTFAQTLPGVTKTVSLVDVMQKLNRNLHGDDPAYYKIPESREAAAQYFLLYELSLPFGRDLTDLVTVDKTESRVTIKLSAVTTKEMLGLIERLDGWLQNNAADYYTTSATSMGVVFANIYWENIGGMLEGTLLALVLITLVMVAIFRGTWLGPLSIFPNVVPIIWAFGFWGFYSGQIDLASSGIAMLAIGIIVDDTVHFLTKYNRALRRGLSVEEAVVATFGEVGRALVVTSVVLSFGFIILSASDFKLNQSMGVLTTACIGFALLADFILLPAILLLVQGGKGRGAPTPQ